MNVVCPNVYHSSIEHPKIKMKPQGEKQAAKIETRYRKRTV
jgi:hypothetical protein